jgi:hypothetical protein
VLCARAAEGVVNVIPLLMLCSLVLVALAVVLFVFSARQGDCHRADRMCLLPLEDEVARPAGESEIEPTNVPTGRPS